MIPSIKGFVEERRAWLLNHEELKKPAPVIRSISLAHEAPGEDRVRAEIDQGMEIDLVLLHFAIAPGAPFSCVAMVDDGAHGDGKAGDGVWGAVIPPQPAGTKVRYYVEARAVESVGTSSFDPPKAEFATHAYVVGGGGSGK